mgnify:CR=1 FL=1
MEQALWRKAAFLVDPRQSTGPAGGIEYRALARNFVVQLQALTVLEPTHPILGEVDPAIADQPYFDRQQTGLETVRTPLGKRLQ